MKSGVKTWYIMIQHTLDGGGVNEKDDKVVAMTPTIVVVCW